ncbi:hypothetical protein BYT27DRAFT_7194377 [Phlegmacium glaucopus]|nr:hypothetical protein BYT27DRAFT_7194377 [Phlegmacium glaucopus]
MCAFKSHYLLVPFLIMGRVTYLHHYLPTLYFSVLMLSHVLDHFIFSSKRYTKKTMNIVFGVLAFIIVFTFWRFKGVVFGITGPIAEYKGLQWRKLLLELDVDSHRFVCSSVSSNYNIYVSHSKEIYEDKQYHQWFDIRF